MEAFAVLKLNTMEIECFKELSAACKEVGKPYQTIKKSIDNQGFYNKDMVIIKPCTYNKSKRGKRNIANLYQYKRKNF